MMTQEEAKKVKFVYRKANFQIDDGEEFAGFTRGESWNGWACPYFVFEVATKVANQYNDGKESRWEYSREKDAFLFFDASDEVYAKEDGDEYEPYTCEGMDIVCDGKTYHVYDIGCGAWVWDEVEKPLTCMDCNELIGANENYIEAMPLRDGGTVGTFCCSDCAGNYFVRKFCRGMTNSVEEALPPQFGEPGYSEQNEQDYLAKRDIEYASEEVFTDLEHEEESMWCKDEPGSICHGCGDCEKSTPIGSCSLCHCPIYEGENTITTEDGAIFCSKSCFDEAVEGNEEYDEKKAQAFNHQQFEEGKTPWIMNYPDVYCFRGADVDFNPDLNDLIKPYNLKKFNAFYWDESRQRIIDSTMENTLERMF
jgi:hypothetical protein